MNKQRGTQNVKFFLNSLSNLLIATAFPFWPPRQEFSGPADRSPMLHRGNYITYWKLHVCPLTSVFLICPLTSVFLPGAEDGSSSQLDLQCHSEAGFRACGAGSLGLTSREGMPLSLWAHSCHLPWCRLSWCYPVLALSRNVYPIHFTFSATMSLPLPS